MTNYKKVREFHKKFSRPLDKGKVSAEESDFRISLIHEEFLELKNAIARGDRVKILDGIADLLYAAYGAAAEYGFDIDEAFARVHESNMSKETTPGNAAGTGKLFKGPNFKPVDLSDLV
jgi:predicted HAD superfamily Cof-like phosphohydrolase